MASIAVVCVLAVVSAVALSALRTDADSVTCPGLPQRHSIAVGAVPGGATWSIGGDVRPNGGCSHWLFGINVVPFGVTPGSWRGAWDIPARGHLSNRFTISAQDEASKSTRAFSGIVGRRVKEIALQLKPDGRKVFIHPKLPEGKARRRFPWLQGFRYFVRFLPTSSPIRVAELINFKGDVISTERPFEGVFEGSG